MQQGGEFGASNAARTLPGPLEKTSTLEGLIYTTMDSAGPPTASPGGSSKRLSPSRTCCLYSSTLSPDTCTCAWLLTYMVLMRI